MGANAQLSRQFVQWKLKTVTSPRTDWRKKRRKKRYEFTTNRKGCQVLIFTTLQGEGEDLGAADAGEEETIDGSGSATGDQLLSEYVLGNRVPSHASTQR